MFTHRRKEAYEALHPETKQGGDRKSDRVDNLSTRSFADDTASKTGVDPRTIRRDAERGGSISERALATLRGTHLDKGVYLDELKRLPNEEDQIIRAIERDLEEARRTLALAKEIRASKQKLKHAVRLATMQMTAERVIPKLAASSSINTIIDSGPARSRDGYSIGELHGGVQARSGRNRGAGAGVRPPAPREHQRRPHVRALRTQPRSARAWTCDRAGKACRPIPGSIAAVAPARPG